jgi:predicted RNA binding protein YcfA (HicA-like mRNA interferase family)
MSPKLPVVSADELVKALEKFGYVAVRQKGSHIRMRHSTDPNRQPLTVPRHKSVRKGLLRRILRDAQITVDQLIEAL